MNEPTWTIQMMASGGYIVRDEKGEIAGQYANTEVSAAHHTFEMQERRALTAAIKDALEELKFAPSTERDERVRKMLEGPIARKWTRIQV